MEHRLGQPSMDSNGTFGELENRISRKDKLHEEVMCVKQMGVFHDERF